VECYKLLESNLCSIVEKEVVGLVIENYECH
jgi:hypothetical protein